MPVDATSPAGAFSGPGCVPVNQNSTMIASSLWRRVMISYDWSGKGVRDDLNAADTFMAAAKGERAGKVVVNVSAHGRECGRSPL